MGPGDPKPGVVALLGSERPSGAEVSAKAAGILAALFLIRLFLPPLSFAIPLAAVAGWVGWYGGRWLGITFAVVGPAGVLALDWLRRAVDPTTPLVWDAVSSSVVFAGIAFGLGYYRDRISEEEHQASTDPLTELPNRGAFLERLDEEVARSGRYGHAFTLVFLDLDGFKAVNDLQGHDEGDLVLQRVADGLRSSTRQTDALGRLGGDEFAALLPHTTFGPAGSVLAKMRRNLGGQMDRGQWPVTFSIGAVTFEAPVDSGKEALRVADEAMYTVKHGNKDGVHHVVWDGDAALA